MSARSTRTGLPPWRKTPLNRPGRDGFVLILVMVVIVMVTLAGLSFVLTLSTESKAARLQGDQVQLHHALASGRELLEAATDHRPEEPEQTADISDNPALFRGVILSDEEDGGLRARFSVISPRMEDGRVTGVKFGVNDESARLNLAVLPQWEAEEPGAAHSALMHLPGMTESIADAILDWIDADDVARASGAEAEYYTGRGLPYGPRNGVPTSLEELLLIRDLGRDLLYGGDVDLNHRVDEQERNARQSGVGGSLSDGELTWASLLTVYSAERNVSLQGQPRIHLNEKDLAKLHEQLNEVFDPQWTEFIIAYRQFGPCDETTDHGSTVVSTSRRGRRGGARARSRRAARPLEDSRSIDLSRPAVCEIDSVLDLVGAAVELPPAGGDTADDVPAGEEPRDEETTILESPFEDDPVAMSDYFPKLVDLTTTVDDPIIFGRVNVNAAPREVLLGVPGLDASIVEEILTARGTAADRDPGRRHATWLVTEGIVDSDAMRRLIRYLTGGGDVYRAQIVAALEGSGLFARAEVVVDATGSPPRQVYWKDLTLLGRGYPLEVLGMESGAMDSLAEDGTRPSIGE